MVRKPFFGLGKPKLAYTQIDDIGTGIQEIPPPEKVTLFLEMTASNVDDLVLSTGDEVQTGQCLRPFPAGKSYLTATATGVISDVSFRTDPMGRSGLSVSIEVREKDLWDPEFEKTGMKPNTETARAFLRGLPGVSDFTGFIREDAPLRAIIVSGFDQDLLVATNQLSLRNSGPQLAQGIDCLQKITGAQKVIVAVPPALRSEADQGGVEVRVLDTLYPGALPRLLIERILGVTVPSAGGWQDVDIGVLSAEAVIALGQAYSEGKPPITKVLTVIDKKERASGVRVRIGTPVNHILESLHITLNEGDRLVFGGPMAGRGVYSEEAAIGPTTDAIMVQDKGQVFATFGDACINCGECVRACPARLPVNMLIRLLENGLYEEAAQEYDLLSCVECGLCSYVCTMRIPIFHYIMLGKHELASTGYLEESNG